MYHNGICIRYQDSVAEISVLHSPSFGSHIRPQPSGNRVGGNQISSHSFLQITMSLGSGQECILSSITVAF
jgi:hypothetical protein